MHESVSEGVGMREDAVSFRRVRHVFLNAEIVHAQIEMQRGAHTHRAQVCRAVRPGPHLINFGQVGDFSQM